MKGTYKVNTAMAVAIIATATAAPAHAQVGSAQPARATADMGGDIIVTARRRSERLQNVPVAVTALSAEDLAKQNVSDVRGIAATTPGLFLEQNPRSSMAITTSLRGQATRDAVITNDQSIGLYIDEVYRARAQGAVTSLFDVQQVQVLRGVQGTLFGRNNTGGAILITTVQPKYELGGRASVQIGEYNLQRYEAVVNVPVIADKLAVRAGFVKTLRDGVIHNDVGGRDGNSRDMLGFRAQVRFDPTDALQFIYRYSYGRADQVPNTAVPNLPGLGWTPPTEFYHSVAGAKAVDQLRSHTHSLTATLDLGDVKIKNIAAYHRQNIFTRSDSDGYPSQLLDVDLVETQRQYTEELQLFGSLLENRLNWLVGAFYFKEKGESSSYAPTILRDTPGFAQNSAGAGFGHLDFKITDRFSIGAGARYTSEKRAIQSSLVVGGACSIAAEIRRAPNVCFADGNANFRYWSWEGNANFQITDKILGYVRGGRGQKAGGFNNITSGALLNPFRPEQATDVEAGLKATWLDGLARTNLALFRTSYKDIQRTQVIPGPGGAPITRVDNAAGATIKGIEAEIALHPTPAVTLGGTFSYVDAKYNSFTYNGADVSNNRFPFVPKYTYSLSADFEHTFAQFGKLNVHSDFTYKDDMEFLVLNRAGIGQKGYGLLNARVSFSPALAPNFQLAVFASNLTDRRYNVAAVELPFGYDVLYRGEPRVVGVELSVRLGGEAR